jgi:hypothetical protein
VTGSTILTGGTDHGKVSVVGEVNGPNLWLFIRRLGYP